MPLTRQRPRTCAACRAEAPKRALVRVVRAPSGKAVLDVTGKLPGRGAYLCPNLQCLQKARKTGCLARVLKAPLEDSCWESLEACIVNYARDRSPEERARELHALLGLSRRARQIFIGMDAIKKEAGRVPQGKETRKKGARALLLLTAEDASAPVLDFADGLTQTRDVPHAHVSLPMNVEALSSALGAGKVQIIALPLRGGLADKIKILLDEGRYAFEQQNAGLRTGEKIEQEQ